MQSDSRHEFFESQSNLRFLWKTTCDDKSQVVRCQFRAWGMAELQPRSRQIGDQLGEESYARLAVVEDAGSGVSQVCRISSPAPPTKSMSATLKLGQTQLPY